MNKPALTEKLTATKNPDIMQTIHLNLSELLEELTSSQEKVNKAVRDYAHNRKAISVDVDLDCREKIGLLVDRVHYRGVPRQLISVRFHPRLPEGVNIFKGLSSNLKALFMAGQAGFLDERDQSLDYGDLMDHIGRVEIDSFEMDAFYELEGDNNTWNGKPPVEANLIVKMNKPHCGIHFKLHPFGNSISSGAIQKLPLRLTNMLLQRLHSNAENEKRLLLTLTSATSWEVIRTIN